MDENLHKLPLELKHISIGQLPYRIINYAKDEVLHQKLKLYDYITYIKVIEHMIQKGGYNLFTLYRNNSLLKQTYNYILVLQEKEFSYLEDYRINNKEELISSLSLEEQYNEAQNEITYLNRRKLKIEYEIYNKKVLKKNKMLCNNITCQQDLTKDLKKISVLGGDKDIKKVEQDDLQNLKVL